MQLGALRWRFRPNCATANCKVVQEFSLAEPKTKPMRQTLDELEAPKTVLLVDNGENRNLALSSRNLEGVKLVASQDVNVYDLLGHEQVLLSEAAARETFGGAWLMTVYDVIKRPIVTEKGVTKKDDERTLCFEVAAGRQ